MDLVQVPGNNVTPACELYEQFEVDIEDRSHVLNLIVSRHRMVPSTIRL